jgi:hypothetical protein
MLPLATVFLYHADSVAVKKEEARVPRDRMRKSQQHRLLRDCPIATAARRRKPIQSVEHVLFDPRAVSRITSRPARHVGPVPHDRALSSDSDSGLPFPRDSRRIAENSS